MFKFRGFRASLGLSGKKKQDALDYDYAPINVSISGAYKKKREEFFGVSTERQKITPSMVRLPPSFGPDPTIEHAKSTSDISQLDKVPKNLQKASSEVSMNPKGSNTDNRKSSKIKINSKELKKLEKLNAEEKNKIDKKRERDKKHKSKAPSAPLQPVPAKRSNPHKDTNIPDRFSSISRTTGPPPYDDVPDKLEVIPDPTLNKPYIRDEALVPSSNDETGNISFSRPIDTGSWDLISQHRAVTAQIKRPVAQQRTKQTVMDLNFSLPQDTNSEV